MNSLSCPSSLTSAPATFQRLMDSVLSNLLCHKVMVYVDGITAWAEHLATLDNVLRRPRAAGLQAFPSKCECGCTISQYLEHIVTREGILPDADSVKAIMQCAAPKSLTELRSWQGTGRVQYYGHYIPHLAQTTVPLYRLYRKRVQFTWSSDCHPAFEEIKGMLVRAALILQTD